MNKRLHITIFICAVLFTVLSSTSCKDKQTGGTPQPCTTCQSVLEAKDYFYFKMGSWWVYEEATTHQRDSMYVTLSQNDPNSYDFDVRIKSSLTDYTYHYWPVYYGGGNSGCTPNGTAPKRCLYVRRGKGKFQNNLAEGNVFFITHALGEHNYTGGDMNYCPNNKITFAAILDSIVLDSFTFHSKTYRIDEDCCYQEGNQPTKFYYTKGIGIVRKEFVDSNQVWNLVNYHIQE